MYSLICLFGFFADFWEWRGGNEGELEAIIPSSNSQLEMGHQSNGPSLWAGEENLLSENPMWSLKPQRWRLESEVGTSLQGRPAGSWGFGSLPFHGAAIPGWIGLGWTRRSAHEICGPKPCDTVCWRPVCWTSALLEGFLLHLRGPKLTPLEFSGLGMSKVNQYTMQYEFNICKPHWIFNQLHI